MNETPMETPPPAGAVVALPLGRIRLDRGTQTRAARSSRSGDWRDTLNRTRVADYTDKLRRDIELPPLAVWVVSDDPELARDEVVLGAGFHRYAAHQRAGRAAAVCRVFHGTLADVIWEGAGSNQAHGEPLTADDQRHLARMFLGDPRFAAVPMQAIADRVGVRRETLSRWRTRWIGAGLLKDIARTVEVRRGGHVYALQVPTHAERGATRAGASAAGAPSTTTPPPSSSVSPALAPAVPAGHPVIRSQDGQRGLVKALMAAWGVDEAAAWATVTNGPPQKKPKRERDPLDRYYTPPALAGLVCDLLPGLSTAPVLEAAAGGGSFITAAQRRDAEVWSCDLDPAAPGLDDADRVLGRGVDFLELPPPADPVGWCPGNPEFARALQHVQHALRWTALGVAWILRWDFWGSNGRRAFWRDHPPVVACPLSPRVPFDQAWLPPAERAAKKSATDMREYGLFVWVPGWTRRAQVVPLAWKDADRDPRDEEQVRELLRVALRARLRDPATPTNHAAVLRAALAGAPHRSLSLAPPAELVLR